MDLLSFETTVFFLIFFPILYAVILERIFVSYGPVFWVWQAGTVRRRTLFGKYVLLVAIVIAGPAVALFLLGGMPLLWLATVILGTISFYLLIFFGIFLVVVTLVLGSLLMLVFYFGMAGRLRRYYGVYGGRFRFSLAGMFWSITWLAVYLAVARGGNPVFDLVEKQTALLRSFADTAFILVTT